MPYDPRPVTEGGNRGIDQEFSRKAPPGKYRVVGVDTFDGGDWLEGDFETLREAVAHATSRAGKMFRMHVYDEAGRHRGEAGRF